MSERRSTSQHNCSLNTKRTDMLVASSARRARMSELYSDLPRILRMYHAAQQGPRRKAHAKWTGRASSVGRTGCARRTRNGRTHRTCRTQQTQWTGGCSASRTPAQDVPKARFGAVRACRTARGGRGTREARFCAFRECTRKRCRYAHNQNTQVHKDHFSVFT
jgi:hypothetical protein